MRKGFTLVELSIVLVIIGLLIGGILVGQSLINTAKINSVVREFQQYEIAITQFHSKYKSMPGESKGFAPRGAQDKVLSWGDTDGDGVLNATACNSGLSNNEVHQFWAQLSQAKMLNKTYPSYSTSACGGTHTAAEYDTGTYTPYLNITSDIDTLVSGYGKNKIALQPNKISADTNLYFGVYFPAMDGLAFASKIGGVVVNDGTNKQRGLTTGSFALNKCGDINYNEVDCGDSAAILYEGLYYMPI